MFLQMALADVINTLIPRLIAAPYTLFSQALFIGAVRIGCNKVCINNVANFNAFKHATTA